MAPDDGEQDIRPAVERSSDAFAATVAPISVAAISDQDTHDLSVPARPKVDAGGKVRASSQLESDETLAAPLPGEQPLLPEVPASNYRTDKEIARGGMGRIMAADDTRLRRRVALKELIDPIPEQIGRFQREALITARLQHPGIVPVYEAGRWPSGEPFFAMKLVSGEPFDKVIAAAKTLDERLALLPRIASAADAIAYAHDQRVIHRDLKPGNILIGKFGETVVIDWGLAKDLDDVESPESGQRTPKVSVKPVSANSAPGSSTLTVAGSVMGTPAYMAPEQARGEPLDERADVFALGAMLYHLLTGFPPYNARTATDVIAAAALGNVVPLEEREHRAPRDLVAIVHRAMEPLPVDRYRNAGELAEELKRFLTGQLVGAHRYTAFQRVMRFVKRHRAAVAIASLAIVTFAIGGTLAIQRIRRERDNADLQRSLAVTRERAAEALIDKTLLEMKNRLTQIGRLDLLASLGGDITDYFGTLGKGVGGMPRQDLVRMAEAVFLVGQADSKSGKPDAAFAMWTETRALLARIVGTDASAATRTERRMIARFDEELGWIHQTRGKIPEAIAAYDLAKHEFDSLKEEAPTDREILLGAAATHDHLGDLLRTEGKIDQAFEEYSEARGEREKANAQGGANPSDERFALSTSHMKLGTVYQARGESATALEEYRGALRLRKSLLDDQPEHVERQASVLEIQTAIAELERQLGDDASAIAAYREALPVMEGLLRRDGSNAIWKRQRGLLFADLGFALLDSGSFKDGLAEIDLAVEAERDLADHDLKNTPYQVELSRSYTRAGDGRIYLGDVDAGIAQYELALAIREHLAAADEASVPFRRSVAWSYHKLGNAYILKNDVAKAIETHEKVLAMRGKLADEAPAQSGFRNELASSQVALGRLLVARDAKRAGELITAGLEHARELVAGDRINNEWKETLVQGLLAQAELTRGNPEARGAALNEALGIAQDAAARAPQNAHWPGFLGEIHVGLAEVATAKGDGKTAAAEWKHTRETLAPLATAGRLAWPRKPLLERALAQR